MADWEINVQKLQNYVECRVSRNAYSMILESDRLMDRR